MLKSKDIPVTLKRKVYKTCMLPVTTYGQKQHRSPRTEKRLEVCQRAIKCAMLVVSLGDKLKNVKIIRRTEISDVMKRMSWGEQK